MKVRTEERREAILEVASQVFLELGFERASMSEIANRVGGSKATLYGYFPSKEALFLAVTQDAGDRHMGEALIDLAADKGGDVTQVLMRFGEKLVAFLCTDEAVAAHRMVLAEAGRSDIGKCYYNAGPQRGLKALSDYFQASMDRGDLRKADPWVTAQHFCALLTAENQCRWFFHEEMPLTRAEMKRMAARAVEAFLGGYRA